MLSKIHSYRLPFGDFSHWDKKEQIYKSCVSFRNARIHQPDKLT